MKMKADWLKGMLTGTKCFSSTPFSISFSRATIVLFIVCVSATQFPRILHKEEVTVTLENPQTNHLTSSSSLSPSSLSPSSLSPSSLSPSSLSPSSLSPSSLSPSSLSSSSLSSSSLSPSSLSSSSLSSSSLSSSSPM